MAGSVERGGEHLTQLTFTTFSAIPQFDAQELQTITPTRRPAKSTRETHLSTSLRKKTKQSPPLPDGLTQHTFDLFASQPRQADVLPITPTRERSEPKEQPLTQLTLSFDSLLGPPPSDAIPVQESEPQSNAEIGDISQSVLHADGQVGDREIHTVFISPTDTLAGESPPSAREYSVRRSHTDTLFDFTSSPPPEISAADERSVEPEPVPPSPSRDFRITEAHGVGTGGLHQKAKDNIAAIWLLKTLEAENREATDEEKAVLVRYAGWGALAKVFERGYRRSQEWYTIATALEDLITPEEYASARATTPNAHFTSPLVITAMWQGLETLGVGKGIEVLEPAMGIGHFFGLMPERMSGGNRTGVELDSLTARIAKKLYPDTTIFATGFEKAPLPDNYFDIVVGNVPFGDYGVHDSSIKPSSLTRSIHDYFFAKSLEKTRPDGILALITSRYTLDKQDTAVRKYLAEKANLIAAIRLPNTAFKENAGTEVTTDILFLQKRAPGQEPANMDWIETKPITINGQTVLLNEYYIRHPEMMLGEMTLTGTMYGRNEPTLTGELTREQLQHAVNRLPHQIYISRGQRRELPVVSPITDQEQLSAVKDGGYAEIDGKIVRREGNGFEHISFSTLEGIRVRGMLQIRDAVRAVFATQLADAPEEEIREARQHLNTVYDIFVSSYGYMGARENFRVFGDDPDYPLLLSLENYNPDTKRATKTAIFAKRTIEGYRPVPCVETASEALAVSLNETGGIDWERMAELTNQSVKDVQSSLVGQVFKNPQGGWETADEYLSGNVRAKLKDAQAAAAITPDYRINVDSLQAVQPEDLKPGDINARLGASWIPKEDIAQFIAQTLQIPVREVSIGHAGEIATWSVKLDYFVDHGVANTTTYGTKRMTASDLIEDALNMRIPTVYDTLDDETRVVNQTETIAAREAQQKLKERFAKWVWEDPKRSERLARLYNDTFNNIRLRTYDGSHLTFPGMNRTNLRNRDLDHHQKNAVWRVLQNKNTLIGHCVGAGKTNEIAAACMELKRVGLAKKPMIVVPNHLVDQWGTAFLTLYPQANLFIAGKEFFTSGKRERAMARIATGNFDAVIVSHKSFESLPVTDKTFNHFVQKEIDSLEEAIMEVKAEKGEGTRSIIKQLEKAKKRLEAKIKDRARRELKDNGVTFEELGIDRIFVDEADLYKNLGFTTKMQRIAGLPNTESNRSLDMYMKTRYVSQRGGGIIFATGTPISNTMAEMYTLQRYLAPELLEAAGMAHFDAWAANFGETVTALELAPDGSGYRMQTRFAKFVNLPELLSQFRTFADIQTADMLNLPRPEMQGGKPAVIVSPASPQLKEYVSFLVERASRVRNRGVDPRTDNMLKVTTDGRKAALDMRLVDPGAEVTHETKLSKAAAQIYRIWKGGREERLTQVVFCDISTPNPDKFNAYDEIRARLLAYGVPEKEMKYIHSADTDAKKKALFESVNTGHVRVLFGSTEKMGAGTNVQERLVALHHIDAPWRPRDIEQRDGRILRQGNRNKAVQIYRYVTEGSFDAYMWQTLETKARFIQQVMTGKVSVREAEDLESGALSFAEIKAIASGNPLVVEKIKIDTEVRRLDMLRAAHRNQQYEISRQVRYLPGQIEKSKRYYAGLLTDIATRNKHDTTDFTMTVAGREFSGKNAREHAGTAITQTFLSSVWDDSKAVKSLGNFKGFELLTSFSNREEDVPYLLLRGVNTYDASLNTDNPLGTIASIEYVLRDLDHLAEKEQSKYEREEKRLAEYIQQQGRPFEHEEHLRELCAKQQKLNSQLDLDKGEMQVVAETQEGNTITETVVFDSHKASAEAQPQSNAIYEAQ
jgi:N12 class adenine-specific DNA methylase